MRANCNYVPTDILVDLTDDSPAAAGGWRPRGSGSSSTAAAVSAFMNALNEAVPHHFAIDWLKRRNWDVDRAVTDWNRQMYD